MKQAAAQVLGSHPKSETRRTRARQCFPPRSCANAEAETTDRIVQARLAQVHSERIEINGFAVVKVHQARMEAGWEKTTNVGIMSAFFGDAAQFER